MQTPDRESRYLTLIAAICSSHGQVLHPCQDPLRGPGVDAGMEKDRCRARAEANLVQQSDLEIKPKQLWSEQTA